MNRTNKTNSLSDYTTSTGYKRNGQIRLGERELKILNEIIEENSGLIYLFAERTQKRSENETLHDDLVQESVMAVYRLFEGKKGFSKQSALKTVCKNLRSIVSKIAAQMRGERQRDVSLELLMENEENPFDVTDEIHDDSYADEETEMFCRLSRLLDRKEMKLAELLYVGHSARETAKRLKLSHTAVNERIKRLREKLAGWQVLSCKR